MLHELMEMLIHPPQSVNQKNYRYFFICRIFFTFGLAFHIGMIFMFHLLQIQEMVIFNVLSVMVFGVGLYLLNDQHYMAALTVVICNEFIHQSLAVVFIGWDGGFQYYILMALIVALLMEKGQVAWKTGVVLLATSVYLYLDINLSDAQPFFEIPETTLNSFNIVNLLLLIGNLTLISLSFNEEVHYFEDALEYEHEKANNLLLNILPAPIAKQLQDTKGLIADEFENTSVLFADIANFTPLSEQISADELVTMLNDLFSRFDDLTDTFGLEKIKTIGDAYMVAAGIPTHRENHAVLISEFALAMLDEVTQFNQEKNRKLHLRIGINSGRVVAGVIGKKKFIYDLWGDTVNIASRMESHGLQDEIQITEDTYNLVSDVFECEKRDLIPVKGKGEIQTWLLKSPKSHSHSHATAEKTEKR